MLFFVGAVGPLCAYKKTYLMSTNGDLARNNERQKAICLLHKMHVESVLCNNKWLFFVDVVI